MTTRGSVAVWGSWETSETMAMPMPMCPLERPLDADPMIPMSFLHGVPVKMGPA